MANNMLRRILISSVIMALWIMTDLYIVSGYTMDQLVDYEGHYYCLFERDEMSFDNAAYYCKAKGGYLASITSGEEDAFLFSYVKSNNLETALFGLSDSETEGNWEWQNGEDVVYTNWLEGQPNGGISENYIQYYGEEGKWIDYEFDCEFFICEWDSYNDINLEAELTRNNVELIKFGSYPQSEVKDENILKQLKTKNGIIEYNGEKYCKKDDKWYIYEPIEWRILKKHDGKVIVMSEKILDACALNNAWRESDARKWLNSTFYNNAFDKKEQLCINSQAVKTRNGSDFEVTIDKLYYPSSDDMSNYNFGFFDDEDRKAADTEYSDAYNTYILRNTWATFIEGYSSAVYAWSGQIVGIMPLYANYGARPCMSIDLASALEITKEKEALRVKDLTQATIKLAKSKFTYDGKAKKPKVTVKFNGKKLSAKYYLVSYKDNKYAGTAKVIVTGRGSFTGTAEKTFTIKPGKAVSVTLYGNNGLISGEESKTVKIKLGNMYGKLAKPKRKRYEFDGWFTKSNGGKEIKGKTRMTKSSAKKLYAHWKEKGSCTITYYDTINNLENIRDLEKRINTVGPEVAISKLTKKIINYSNKNKNQLPANIFKHDGWAIAGWRSVYNLSKIYKPGEEFKTMPSEDLKLFTVWKPYYTIKYIENGGSGKMGNQIIYFEDNAKVKLKKCAFSRAGYEFVGWKTGANHFYLPDKSVDHLSQQAGKIIKLNAVWVKESVSSKKTDESDSNSQKPVTAIINKKGSSFWASWSNAYFKQQKKYSYERAKISALAAASTYANTKVSGKKEPEKLLQQCGFDASSIKCIYTGKYALDGKTTSVGKDDNNDHCTIYIGKKKTNGENLIAVIISGYSAGGYEWKSNFKLGRGDCHEGFDKAATEVMQILNDIFSAELNSNKVKVWITGHSRGGAITNFVAKSLMDKLGEENVFAYGFATPNGVSSATKTKSIVNIINSGDFVPYVAPTDWGYTKHGTNIEFQPSDEAKNSYRYFTGKGYNGNGPIARDILIKAFCFAGKSKSEYYDHVYDSVDMIGIGISKDPSLEVEKITITPAEFFQQGLGLAMNENESEVKKGISTLINGSKASDELAAVFVLLVAETKISLLHQITDAHEMELYLAYVNTSACKNAMKKNLGY